ncbi:TonB-dependent receptor [Caulobacter sp. NIBR2454]|uniref:TonB-dependent receptor n=1 Tax=Caulobacter sp. NIBR2454 TaxID=3015996 RepID=UPI0022B7319B|nr:carboxypeptidase regulatory-like domain-containing protein [Caulobacter sp. NIBR2454]
MSSLLAGVATMGAPGAVAILGAALPTVASAQDYSSGTLLGEVTNADGQPVAGATVVVRSMAQGVERTLTTDSDGSFRVPLIPTGNYSIAIEAPGYVSTRNDTVRVGLSGASRYGFTLTAEGEVSAIEVTATANPQQDFTGTTTGISVDVEQLTKQVPIARNVTALTLLAPSAVPIDSAFAIGSAQLQAPASLSGASGGENAYYVNGLNITNFINGIGGATVPFDFYKSIDIKTGGYSAEYGRAIGGVINAVTKSGSNDFMFALHGNYEPNKLRSDSPNGELEQYQLYDYSEKNVVLEAGGPILKDRLFFYGLAQFADIEGQRAQTSGALQRDRIGDPFYGFKLDGYVTPKHHLEFTYFDTSRKRKRDNFSFDPDTNAIESERDSASTLFLGGESYVARYTGTLFDWLTVSGAYGRSEVDQALLGNLFGVPLVQDARVTPTITVGAQSASSSTFPFLSEREFYRGDIDVFFKLFGDHHIRAGYDRENTVLTETSVRNGGANYFYRRAAATNSLGLAEGQEYLERRVFDVGGGFRGRNTAIYVQDAWDVTDRLALQIGWRQDKFAVETPLGETFIEFDDEQALRLGATYDLAGDGRTKVFGFMGRYYLPVASNTSFRAASPAIDFTEFFLPADGGTTFGGGRDPLTGLPAGATSRQVLNGPNMLPCPASLPSIAPTGAVGCTIRNNGTAPPPETVVSLGLKSTYEDEVIFGVSHKLSDLWSVGLQFRRRELGRVAEDALLDDGVVGYCRANNIAGCEALYPGGQFYNIINPGFDATVVLPTTLPNGETQITLKAADLRLPKVKRKYQGLEFTFERAFDGKWGLQGSYTVSESIGNFEGALKSDTGQTDAGIVSDFDFLAFIPGQYGLLPNHHAHQFKAFGSYAVTDSLMIGANASVISPRKYGCIGLAPEDYLDGATANANYDVENARFCGGQLVKRGSAFETDWIKRLDLSLRYTVPEKFSRAGNLVLRADVFNVLNLKGVQEAYEFGELPDGRPDEGYKQPTAYQTPRYVRFGFDWEF